MAKESKSENFSGFIEKERERLSEQRSELMEQRAEIDRKISTVDNEMSAISAYERARTGKASRTGRGGGRRGVRSEVFAEVQRHKGGVKRAKLLESLGAKGDKAKETSISNALAALKRQGQIDLDSSGYKAV